jgi:hypothetical protein
VRLLGFALGGEAGSRLADRLRMATSPSTLLRLIRRTPDPMAAPPRVLGVDDFAVRKGRTSGTLLVDLERHRPIELLPDRTSGSLAALLKAHPGIEGISRDRSTEYARGATGGAPQAIQVADRFHLLVNLREALERLFDRNRVHLRGFVLPRPGDVAIPTSAQRQPARRSPVEETARQAHIAARYERHAHIQALHEPGLASSLSPASSSLVGGRCSATFAWMHTPLVSGAIVAAASWTPICPTCIGGGRMAATLGCSYGGR